MLTRFLHAQALLILLASIPACASREQPVERGRSSTQTPTASRRPRPSLGDIIERAAVAPSLPFEGEGWQALFDGKSLTGWRETEFSGRGDVECRSNLLVLNMGDPFTGINYTNEFPTMNYEVALDAMRAAGSDFFCGLTVPVGDSFCSLIVGGWGGSLLGISSIDTLDASENETTTYFNFDDQRWYRIRLRVTEHRLEAWLDDKKMVTVDTRGKRVSLRPGEIEMSKPFGISSWQTAALLRELRMRRVTAPAGSAK